MEIDAFIKGFEHCHTHLDKTVLIRCLSFEQDGQILTTHGFGGEHMMLMHGGIDQKEREKIKAAFQAHPDISPVRILLATDAASEGIDLQNYCNYMIHIEIPWNPNVMEQRNGRIDRHGQKESEVFIWHPVGKGFESNKSIHSKKVGQIEGDHEYLMRAVLKIDTIREDLGSVGPVPQQGRLQGTKYILRCCQIPGCRFWSG